MSDKETEDSNHVQNPHPPAVKAGGMRIVQDKSRLKKNSTSEETVPQVDGVPHVQNSPPKAAAYLKDDNVEFSPKAVQAFHDKPEPSRNSHASTKPHVLHQPRK